MPTFKSNVKVTLTPAQRRLVHEVIEAHVLMGDCKAVSGFSLVFADYEGFQAVRNEVFKLGSGSTRAYVSMNSIVARMDAAIVVALAESAK